MSVYDFSALPDVRSEHPELTQDGELAYAAHMQARENAYHVIFGTSHPEGRILVPCDTNLTINWPGGGVFQYAPSGKITGWHYVTHGLSQPYEPEMQIEENKDACSGFGIELVISTPDEAAWAPDVLLNLVKYLLFQKDSRPILPGHRVPCNGPLVLNTDTQLTYLLAVSSPEYPNEIRLPAGYCDLVHMVGVTASEIARAVDWGNGNGGSFILEEVLRRMGVGVLSNQKRDCLTHHPEFESIWTNTQNELETQWRKNGWSRDK